MKTVVLYGSMRESREGIKLAKFLCKELEKRKHIVNFIDAKELNLPILVKRYSDYPKGESPKVLQDLAEIYTAADGFILVTGEYNYSVQPGLKNLLDHFVKEYQHRPCAIASYSISSTAGARAALSWRVIVAALSMVPIPFTLSIPKIQENFTEAGEVFNNTEISKNAQKFLQQFEWYEEALKNQRIIQPLD